MLIATAGCVRVVCVWGAMWRGRRAALHRDTETATETLYLSVTWLSVSHPASSESSSPKMSASRPDIPGVLVSGVQPGCVHGSLEGASSPCFSSSSPLAGCLVLLVINRSSTTSHPTLRP